jgi:hypothetical protein
LKFLDEVDPNRTLPEPERLRRAEHARSAYFTKLALKSVQARARALIERTTAEQGLPEKVEDPATLSRLASLLEDDPT